MDLRAPIAMDPAAVVAIWAAARTLERVAAEVRDLADQAGHGLGVDWQSVAADSYRRGLDEQLRALGQTAAGVDEAAAALGRHARSVQGGGSW